MNELEQFYKNALMGSISEPLCDEYKNYWRMAHGDKEKLVRLALRQQSLPFFISYCNCGKGVSKDFILENFGKEINGTKHLNCDGVDGNYEYAMYVAKKGICSHVGDVSAWLWCDCPRVEIEATRSETLYVGCNSKIQLSCDGYNSIIVYLFDESIIEVEDLDENSTLLVYKFSDMCRVKEGRYCFGKIYEHRKGLRL